MSALDDFKTKLTELVTLVHSDDPLTWVHDEFDAAVTELTKLRDIVKIDASRAISSLFSHTETTSSTTVEAPATTPEVPATPANPPAATSSGDSTPAA